MDKQEDLQIKEELKELVEKVKANYSKKGIKITQEEMAQRLDYGRTHVSNLLGTHGKVTPHHIAWFQYVFKEELKEEEDKIRDSIMIKMAGKLTPAQKEELLNEDFSDPEERNAFQKLLN